MINFSYGGGTKTPELRLEMLEYSDEAFDGRNSLSSLEFVQIQNRKTSDGAREVELILKPQSGEFQLFLQKTLQFEHGEIESSSFARDLASWFPPLAQYPSASLTLQVTLTAEQRISFQNVQLSSQPQPPPQIQHQLKPPPKAQPRSHSQHSPPLSKNIKKTNGINHHSRHVDTLKFPGLIPTKVSGKAARLKNFWNKVDPSFPFVYKKLFCFRKKGSNQIFEVESVILR